MEFSDIIKILIFVFLEIDFSFAHMCFEAFHWDLSVNGVWNVWKRDFRNLFFNHAIHGIWHVSCKSLTPFESSTNFFWVSLKNDVTVKLKNLTPRLVMKLDVKTFIFECHIVLHKQFPTGFCFPLHFAFWIWNWFLVSLNHIAVIVLWTGIFSNA